MGAGPALNQVKGGLGIEVEKMEWVLQDPIEFPESYFLGLNL